MSCAVSLPKLHKGVGGDTNQPCLAESKMKKRPFKKLQNLLPARCHPKLIFFVAGRDERTAIAKRPTRNPTRSENRCAASVIIARLLAMIPPEIKTEQL